MTTTLKPNKWDRGALYASIVFGVIAAGWTIVHAVAVVGTIACVCLVIRNLIAGRAFDRSTVALVGTATVTVAFGWVLTWLFRTMGANGGASALSDKTVFNSTTGADPVIIFAIASLGALAFAFTAGGRLQRETEGLV